jgi:hypothetical protein
MSNPVEKYFQETGQTTLIVKKDKFLNKVDIEDLEAHLLDAKDRVYYDYEKKGIDNLLEKLEYIRGLLK